MKRWLRTVVWAGWLIAAGCGAGPQVAPRWVAFNGPLDSYDALFPVAPEVGHVTFAGGSKRQEIARASVPFPFGSVAYETGVVIFELAADETMAPDRAMDSVVAMLGARCEVDAEPLPGRDTDIPGRALVLRGRASAERIGLGRVYAQTAPPRAWYAIAPIGPDGDPAEAERFLAAFRPLTGERDPKAWERLETPTFRVELPPGPRAGARAIETSEGVQKAEVWLTYDAARGVGFMAATVALPEGLTGEAWARAVRSAELGVIRLDDAHTVEPIPDGADVRIALASDKAADGRWGEARFVSRIEQHRLWILVVRGTVPRVPEAGARFFASFALR